MEGRRDQTGDITVSFERGPSPPGSPRWGSTLDSCGFSRSKAPHPALRSGMVGLCCLRSLRQLSSLRCSLRCVKKQMSDKNSPFRSNEDSRCICQTIWCDHEPRIESRPAELKTNSGSLIGQRRLSVGPSGPKRRTRFLPKCRTQICNYCPPFSAEISNRGPTCMVDHRK